jgi:inhibitor of cysteine peptidase
MFKRLPIPPVVAIGVSALTLALVGCPNFLAPSPGPGQGTETGPAKLVPFESPQALLNYFKDQATPYAGRGTVDYSSGGVGTNAAMPPAAEEDQAGGTSGGTSGDTAYSTTNLQEEGVDESDVFKSDGTYFYIASEQTLRIVRAAPPDQMAEVGQLDLKMYTDALYLQDSTVIALGMKYPDYIPLAAESGRPEIMIWPPYYGGANLSVAQIDVTDPAQPQIIHQLDLDGSVVSSRLTNGRLIIVLTIMPQLPANSTAPAIQDMSLEQVMPKMQGSGGTADMVPWERWLRPVSPDGYCMTAVVTLDASNVENVVHSVAVLANAGTIYASTEALYFTDSEYDPQNNYREKTAIHKFKFNTDGAAEYVASGSVPGRLLNQFSLGEYNDYLRVATHVSDFGLAIGVRTADEDGVVSTDAVAPVEPAAPGSAVGSAAPGQASPSQPFNAVYVLGESEADLAVVGKLENLEPGEQMYAARFLGTRGYLVTFKQIDPLLVVDLTDPQNPTLTGQLVIPGFSEYLHPLGDTHLIGVGHSTAQTVWGGVIPDALQLSLFDVHDLANPTLVQQIPIGGMGSYTDVSQTHKAFTLVQREGRTLIALPAVLTRENSDYGVIDFDGVLCFCIDPAAADPQNNAIQELGRVDLVAPGLYMWPQWRRAAFIGDDLYAVTPDGVRTAPISDFSATHELTLEPAVPGNE